MRKYIRYLVLIMVILIGISCKDYLNTTSPSSFTEFSVFNTNIDFAEKAVFAIYNQLPGTSGWNTMMLYASIDSDQEFYPAADEGNIASLSHYALSTGTVWIETMWNMLYNVIEKSNIVIDNLPKSTLWTDPDNSDKAHRLYAEAITLRAFAYNQLIALWGDVPFRTHSAQGSADFILPKTDRDSIYEACIKDLKDVEDYIPWLSQTLSSERINKAFIKGLRARMCLMYGGWSLRNKTHVTARGRHWQEYYGIARQECLEIMRSGKHTLNPGFEQIFRNMCSFKMDITYGEVLWELAGGTSVSGSLGFTVGMKFATGDPKYGVGNPQLFGFPQYYYNFNRADSRRDVSTCLYDYSGTGALFDIQQVRPTAFYSQLTKWRKSWIVPALGGTSSGITNTGINFPIMRYSDVILMYAETENELNGPTQAAKDALSLVRQRAFPSGTWPTTVVNYVDSVAGTGKAGFFNAIVDERYFEFGGEFIRKFDLIRWNLLYTKIAQAKTEMRQITTNPVTNPKYANVPPYLFYKLNTDGETLSILNPDFVLPSTAIQGYTMIKWIPSWSASQRTTYYTKFDYCGDGLKPDKNNYLFPLGTPTISSSNGVLTNDQLVP